jgi:hypothetical protein
MVLNSPYVADVGHDQVTFQLRGNLVVSKVILSNLFTAWCVSLLMLKIQLVEPAQIHKMTSDGMISDILPVPVAIQRPLLRSWSI